MPFELNSTKINNAEHGPFKLNEKIEKIDEIISKLNLTPSNMKMQFIIEVLGKGEHTIENFNENGYDCWLWQLEGESQVNAINELNTNNLTLNDKDSVLIPANHSKTISISVIRGHLLKVIQDPRLK